MSDGLEENSIIAADAQPIGAFDALPANCESVRDWLTRQQAAAAIGGLPMPEGPAEAILTERRRCPRRSYPYYQRVAPIIGSRLPHPSEFVRVCCNDIAAGGFSFLASQPPPSHSLIVALGNQYSVTYVTAQVVHVTRVRRNGKYTYLVGCVYTGRARY